MDWIGLSALITAVAGGIVSLITVYMQLNSRINQTAKENHASIIEGYQDLLARSHAQAEVFREEITKARDEGRTLQDQARDFFAAQLERITLEFSNILQEQRKVALEEHRENRQAMQILISQNADEHKAIIASIDELRERIEVKNG